MLYTTRCCTRNLNLTAAMEGHAIIQKSSRKWKENLRIAWRWSKESGELGEKGKGCLNSFEHGLRPKSRKMLGLPSGLHMAYMFAIIDARTESGTHCVGIRPRNLRSWCRKCVAFSSRDFPLEVDAYSISDVAHKMMATYILNAASEHGLCRKS